MILTSWWKKLAALENLERHCAALIAERDFLARTHESQAEILQRRQDLYASVSQSLSMVKQDISDLSLNLALVTVHRNRLQSKLQFLERGIRMQMRSRISRGHDLDVMEQHQVEIQLQQDEIAELRDQIQLADSNRAVSTGSSYWLLPTIFPTRHSWKYEHLYTR